MSLLSKSTSWKEYYKDNGLDDVGEKDMVRTCTSRSIEEHLLNHVSSATGLIMKGDPIGAYVILENFLYDISQATALNLTLDPDLFDDYLLTKPEIRHDIRQELLDKYPEIHTLDDTQFLKEIAETLTVQTVAHVKVRSYILGQHFNVLERESQVDFPVSKYNYSEAVAARRDSSFGNAFRGLTFHLTALPFIFTLSEMDTFFTTDSQQYTLQGSAIEDMRVKVLERKRVFWKKLVGTDNPTPEELKEALTNVEDFSEYFVNK